MSARSDMGLARAFRHAVRRAGDDPEFRALLMRVWTARSGARVLESGLLDDQAEEPVAEQARKRQAVLMGISRAVQGEARAAGVKP